MKKLILLAFIGLLFIPLKTQAVDIIDGDLIRADDGIDVYIIKLIGDKKFKRLILNPEIFNKYGHLKWENIKAINQAVLDEYTTSDLVRAVGDDRVYKLYPNGDMGEKKWIKTADDFLDLGYDWNSIYEINSFERDFYLPGEDLISPAPPESPVAPTTPTTPTTPTIPTSPTTPTIINVPGDYSTIQKAIDAAINGDTISVGSGTYNENIIINKNIKLIGDFAESVILNGQNKDSAISISGADDFLIQRFTIKNQNNKGIYCSGENLSKGKIKNVIFTESAWGIYSEGNCDFAILNNIFYENRNSVDGKGAGILIKNSFSYGITLEIINNTIDDNYNGVWIENANAEIMNSIITNNLGGGNSTGIYHGGEGQTNNTYNDVWQNGFNYGGDARAGSGSLSSYPQYFLASQRNYKLNTAASTLSPCIDKGNPDPVYNDKILLSGNVNYKNDIGAYGGPDNIGWTP